MFAKEHELQELVSLLHYCAMPWGLCVYLGDVSACL